MEIVALDRENLGDIEMLWRELNAHHLEHSNHFKGHFSSFTFKDRSRKLLAREKLAVFAAKDEEALVGFCIASAEGRAGEIDSLYVKPRCHGQNLGSRLTECAMDWLHEQGCNEISVYVAEGNEAALPFYERFGFRKRYDVLQIKS